VTTTTHRGRTVAELAQRWRMSEETALEFLEAFRRRGYARRRGGLWFATEKATRIIGFGPVDG
jgi:DNA-binding IclR family transcriptional regulator